VDKSGSFFLGAEILLRLQELVVNRRCIVVCCDFDDLVAVVDFGGSINNIL
jgi:hypothetical protein